MSGMSVGTVTVNQNTGSWSGSGMALALMNAIQPLLVAQLPAGYSVAVLVGVSNGAAAVAQGAAALVTYVKGNATVTIPAGSLGGGIPASDTVLSANPIG